MRGLGEEWRRQYDIDDWGDQEESERTRWTMWKMTGFSSYSTAIFVAALILSLVLLGLVNPTSPSLSSVMASLVWVSVGLTSLGGVMMIVFLISTHRLLYKD